MLCFLSHMLELNETIVAIASAAGGAARGIVRLSGADTLLILQKCCSMSQDVSVLPQPRVVSAELSIPLPMGSLPGDLYVWPNQRSYTRQPMAEFHTVGSPPVLAAVLNTLCDAGARLAQPGEFTLRAFLAGRLDLTQAEAVLGVIDAQGRKPLDTALGQLAGGLARPLRELREALLDLLAQLEAGLDFAEEDIQFIASPEVNTILLRVQSTVADLLAQMQARSATTELPRIVLAGHPNAGKSSLFNAIVGQTAAIVSSQPGTTRDYLTAIVDLAGMRCELIDTAGADEQLFLSSIGQAAQQATAAQHEQASVILLCLDASRPVTATEQAWLKKYDAKQTLVVLTKADQPRLTDFKGSAIATSVLNCQGLPELAKAIRKLVGDAAEETCVVGTAERCQESLIRAQESLVRAILINQQQAGEELLAAELRFTLEELGKVVGAVYTDDILDRIFSRFCIGK